ncbi:hypothetical protein CDCA_CDCA06G1775 [Cyanidium caldarium]|uniref:Uncharacterized protein n=1 Tax=Cyanidium caldarium TaxID=2771 RepID=A0AAV9IUG4_CYACA|nr:hypothetical protein CDCA_CDCA06G1775 [Cyanidium caldarium]
MSNELHKQEVSITEKDRERLVLAVRDAVRHTARGAENRPERPIRKRPRPDTAVATTDAAGDDARQLQQWREVVRRAQRTCRQLGHVVLDVSQPDEEREQRLRLTATRGVVQLFNAFREHQIRASVEQDAHERERRQRLERARNAAVSSAAPADGSVSGGWRALSDRFLLQDDANEEN